MTTTIPAQLVKKFNIPVVPIFIERINGINFKITINKPLNFSKETSIKDITIELNQILEKNQNKKEDIEFNILIKNNSFILIENGNLIVNGTKRFPVNIESFDDYWGGIYVKNSKNSKIENLNIKNLDN